MSDSNAPLTIWVNQGFPDADRRRLEAGVGRHRISFAEGAPSSNLAAGKSDAAARSADVLLGQPPVEDLKANPNLKWVQITSAGYTRFDNDAVREAIKSKGAALCNSSSVFDAPCAQHLLAMILSFCRLLPLAAERQVQRDWSKNTERERRRLIGGQSIALVGFGSIARKLVDYLAPFDVKIVGVRRSPTGEEPVETIETDALDGRLGEFDHVADLLPSHPATRGHFNADRFGAMKEGAYFYNIGRGDTVDQPALIAALQSGRLAGAYLDVTTPEPLPAESPLWAAPNCHITPHAAGGYAGEEGALVDHFLANLERFERGEDLVDRVM